MNTPDPRLESGLNHIMQSPDARFFLRHIIRMDAILELSPFSSDPYTTAYSCGILAESQQLVGFILSINPAYFSQLLMEQYDDDRNGNAADGNDAGDQLGFFDGND